MPIKIKLTKDENGNIKDIVLNPITMTIEKQVWESTLNRSMVLQADNDKLKTDCKTLAQKLLQVKPELKEWLEVNFKEYL